MTTPAPVDVQPTWRALRPQIVTTLAVFGYFFAGIPYAMSWSFGARAPWYLVLVAVWLGFGALLWRAARQTRAGLAVLVTAAAVVTWVAVLEAGLAWWGWSTHL